MSKAYVNGNVYTVDDKRSTAEAFIVTEDGFFGDVGTTAEILALAKGLEVIDLKGRFVMPGIHDAHCHLLMASQEKLFEAKLGTTTGPEEIVEKLKEHRDGCKHLDAVSNWLVGNFYHYANFKDGKPDRQFLDEAFGDQPVVIREYTTHNIFVNTAALRAVGYEDDPEDPPGGYFVRREDGSITGELVEMAASKIFYSMPKYNLKYNTEALEYGVKMLNRFGVTSVQEASANTIYLDTARELEKTKGLSLHISAHVVWYGAGAFSAESIGNLHHTVYKPNVETYKTKHFDPLYTKCWLDGVPWVPHETHCAIKDDKIDFSKLLIPPETFRKGIEKFDSEGRTCKVHVCGQGSARFALDCFEEIRKKNPNGPRHELAHNMDVTVEDCKRYKELNITAEMSPAIWQDPEFQPEVNPKSVYPFNALKDHGALLTIGSDWVFSPDTPNIFPGLQAITENKHGWDLTRKEVVDMITINGAHAINKENIEGSIEKGKLANFIFLDRDLINAPNIADTIVHKTFFEGKEVYDYDTDELKYFQGTI
ncbi:amidohydrolase 3 [Scheffersomyces coipomensis]|uniref:amidohydrolase 3 n=1 Tax=Scheffersomyces coipomensis TaxID=1788519 RepID=UPI00315D97A2